MVSVCLPSDALLQHVPSYLGFSYLGRGVSLHGCSSKAQPLLLTLDEGYLLTAAPPDLSAFLCPRSHHSLDVGLHVVVSLIQFSSVQSLSCVRPFATPWIAAHQASLSITNSRSSLRLMSIESVMPSSHLILCRPLLLLPSIPPSIRVFSNESA